MSRNFLFVEKFWLKNAKMGLKTIILKRLKGKIEILSTIIFSVGNL